MLKYGMNTCTVCGKEWYGPLCGAKYCVECRKNPPKKEKPSGFRPMTAEVHRINKLANEEGLSYGKYCAKHGI